MAAIWDYIAATAQKAAQTGEAATTAAASPTGIPNPSLFPETPVGQAYLLDLADNRPFAVLMNLAMKGCFSDVCCLSGPVANVTGSPSLAVFAVEMIKRYGADGFLAFVQVACSCNYTPPDKITTVANRVPPQPDKPVPQVIPPVEKTPCVLPPPRGK